MKLTLTSPGLKTQGFYALFYKEWNKNIEATESTLISALFMCMDPLDITQESVEGFGEVLRARMITIGDD